MKRQTLYAIRDLAVNGVVWPTAKTLRQQLSVPTDRRSDPGVFGTMEQFARRQLDRCDMRKCLAKKNKELKLCFKRSRDP